VPEIRRRANHGGRAHLPSSSLSAVVGPPMNVSIFKSILCGESAVGSAACMTHRERSRFSLSVCPWPHFALLRALAAAESWRWRMGQITANAFPSLIRAHAAAGARGPSGRPNQHGFCRDLDQPIAPEPSGRGRAAIWSGDVFHGMVLSSQKARDRRVRAEDGR
jgi:hypothetical protein